MQRVVAFLLIFMASFFAYAQDGHALRLDGGFAMKLTAIPVARNIPYVYVDQAVETLASGPTMGNVLASRRLGRLGTEPEISYSLIAYTQPRRRDEVSIEGQVVVGDKAWMFAVMVPFDQWKLAMIVVLEKLSTLPTSSSPQMRAQ